MRRRWRGIEYTADDELPMLMGEAHAYAHPWDLDEDFAEGLAEEIVAREARRRPAGFQAVWPESDATTEEGSYG